MKPQIGKKYLITCDNWFVAPDGQSYLSVFGTVTGVYSDQETLGIKTNRGSTNWYVEIGNMLIAGCQIHFAIKTDSVSAANHKRDIDFNGKSEEVFSSTRIYSADG